MTQDNSTAQLLPCPFCGSTEDAPIERVVHITFDEESYSHRYGVQCDGCCAFMGSVETEEEAIAAWNTRAPVSQDAEQLVERLRTIEAALTDVGADIRELRLADAHAARTGWEGRWDRALHAVCQHENRIKTLLTKGVATEAADLIEALTRVQPSSGLDMGAQHE